MPQKTQQGRGEATARAGGDVRAAGTGGRPNLQVISDYGTSPHEHWFQLHTMVRLNDDTAANDLKKMLAGGTASTAGVMEILINRGSVSEEGKLRGMLQAALAK